MLSSAGLTSLSPPALGLGHPLQLLPSEQLGHRPWGSCPPSAPHVPTTDPTSGGPRALSWVRSSEAAPELSSEQEGGLRGERRSSTPAERARGKGRDCSTLEQLPPFCQGRGRGAGHFAAGKHEKGGFLVGVGQGKQAGLRKSHSRVWTLAWGKLAHREPPSGVAVVRVQRDGSYFGEWYSGGHYTPSRMC